MLRYGGGGGGFFTKNRRKMFACWVICLKLDTFEKMTADLFSNFACSIITLYLFSTKKLVCSLTINLNMSRERERNVLFNDALNTFYLRLYGVRHMVKDHSDSEKGNPLPPHRLLLSINSKGSFICTIPQTG